MTFDGVEIKCMDGVTGDLIGFKVSRNASFDEVFKQIIEFNDRY